MVLGQTPIVAWETPDPFTLPTFETVAPIDPLQASQPTAIFSPGATFGINAVAIGGAILLGVLVMRGLRK